ncbi:unnamed protein product [Heterobilharzia americana]|nr:unnamed protein product [Heterobilharzia americana]
MNEQFTFIPNDRFPSKDLTKKFYHSKNPYDDENAILQALNKKPLCIIILGKPCSGKTELAKRLCSKWKLQLVNASELIIENIDAATEVGKLMNETMSIGQALDAKTVYNLVIQKLESPECAHYGYVLDDLPSYCESSISIEEQMAYITSMNLKPDFIIHIKISQEDILKRRKGLRIDIENGTLYSSRNYTNDVKLPDEPQEKFANKVEKVKQTKSENDIDDDPDNAPEDEAAEAMDEGEGEEDRLNEPSHPDFERVDKERLEYLISRLEDHPEIMEPDFKYHEENIFSHISSYLSKFNPFSVVELDGNLTPTELFYNLLVKLQGMNLYPSVAPMRFFGPSAEEEEEVIPEDMDTEELFQTLAIKKMPGPRARWRKSPWKRLCPVALYEGQLSVGKPEFTVGYLGQIFCMSDIAKFTSFIKNPRPYLLPPQPRPPFRVVVLGAKASGKTQLVRVLAESYRARIIDLVGMLQDEHDKILSKKLVEVETKTEAIVIQEVTERHEAELQTFKASKMAEHTSEVITQKVTEEIEGQVIGEAVSISDEDSESEKKKSQVAEETEKPFSVYIPEHLRQPVDKNHPEVKTRVREALHIARQEPIELDIDLYINAVRAAVDEAEAELRKDNPGGPYHGQWIIDGLPVRPDVWKEFIEKAPDLLPDLFVYLQDTSQNSEYLLRRWIKLKIEEFNDIDSVDQFENTDSTISQDFETGQPTIPDETSILAGRQGQAALQRIKEIEKQWSQSADLLTRAIQPLGAPVDVYELSLFDKTIDQMRDEVLDRLVKPFKLEAIPKTQDDIDEEEDEDAGAFEEQIDENYEQGEEFIEGGEENEQAEEGGEELEEEGEGEEEPDPSRNLQKKLGLTSYFCPVTLHDYEVLRAGDPEIVAVYQNLVYYFANEEARSKFIENPEAILNTFRGPLKPPPPRILIIGPTGTGKSLHSRQIALNLNLVHINFQGLLQEVTFPKFGRKIGKEYADHEPIPDIELPPLEEPVGEGGEDQEKLDNAETERLNTKTETISKESELEQPPLLNEHETNVSEYLLNATPIPNETLECIEDLQFLVTSNYIFDYAIFLTSEVDEVVSRLLPPRLEMWRKRMAKKNENAAKLKEWKAAKKKLAMDKRRMEILRQLQEKRENTKLKPSFEDADGEEDEELDDEVDIDEMLAEEFAEDEDEIDAEEEETEADAIERITEEITETFTEASDIYAEISEQIEELSIPKYEIDSGGRITWARYRIVKRLHSLMENRDSIFERVYPVTPKIAERLLVNGYYFPSRFGRWCPVTLYFQDAWLPPIPMPYVKVGNPKYLSMLPGLIGETLPVVNAKTCAAIYKQHIYWSTKTGKTTIVRRLAKEYNIPVVNPGDCIRWILKDPSHMYTSLANRIREQFNRGEAISDELTAEAIQTLLLNGIYFTRGYIIENYPLTKEQGELLFAFGVRPNLVLNLAVTNEKQKEELIRRGIKEASLMSQSKLPGSHSSYLTFNEEQRTEVEGMEEHTTENEPERKEEGFKQPAPEVDIAQELVIRLAAYDSVMPQLREWYISQNGLMVELEAFQNRWLLWRKLIVLIKHRMKHVQEYMERITAYKAASIAELGIRQCEYEKLSSGFRQYCPVTLRERQELEDTINEPKYEFIIQLNINNKHRKETLDDYHNDYRKTLWNKVDQNNDEDDDNNNNDDNNNSSNDNDNNDSNDNEESNKVNNNEDRHVKNVISVVSDTIPFETDIDALNCPIKIFTTMRFTAEYEGHYYRMAGPNELQAFLTNPTIYTVPNNMYTLPHDELIPVRLKEGSLKKTRDAFPIQLALKWLLSCLKLGLQEYLAHYDNKIYTFCSNDCLLEFLRKPVLFDDLKLPHKLPPVATIALRRALSAVSQDRPKFPFIEIKRSALIYVGLHLKAYNTRFSTNEKKKYQQKLHDYMDACLLIPWLTKSMPIQFHPASKRSIEFNKKLDNFLSFERHKDLPETWIKWDN